MGLGLKRYYCGDIGELILFKRVRSDIVRERGEGGGGCG